MCACVRLSVLVLMPVIVPGSIPRAEGSRWAARTLFWPGVAAAEPSLSPGGGQELPPTAQIRQAPQRRTVRTTRRHKNDAHTQTHFSLCNAPGINCKAFLQEVPLNCAFFYVIYTEEYTLISTYVRGHMYIVCAQHCHQHIHATLSSKWPHPYYAN